MSSPCTIFNYVMLEHDLLASVMCLNLPNPRTVLTFIDYIGCLQGTGTYCIGYCNHHFIFQFYVYFVHSYILNICFCLYFNYFVVFFNINFKYINIQHTYTTILQRNVYVLTILPFDTISTVYKSG
jgi:hypothetical protein